MKVLFCAAIAAMMSVSVFAVSNSTDSVSVNQLTMTQTTPDNDDYKEITADSLGQNVKLVVDELAKSNDVSKLEYSESKKLTRVSLTNKETKEAKVVVLDEDGKIVE